MRTGTTPDGLPETHYAVPWLVLERAQLQGKVLGRPRIIMDRSKIAKLRDQGLSLREIVTQMAKSTMTVQRSLKALA